MERYLIVGLGNPGAKYENTRHNVGWMVVEDFARRHRLRFDNNERKSITADGMIAGKRVLVVKPQTYMNLSGEAVRALIDFYKIDIERIIVVHDDLDIPLGMLRLRKGGGHGGQNGVRHIIQHLGTRDFSRIRFGIGRPPGKMNPVDYVLQKFKQDEAILARETCDRATNALDQWLAEGIEAAMTQYNGNGEQPTQPQRNPEEALAIYARAHELAPDDPAPLEKMVGVLKQMGQLDEAADIHLQIAELYVKQKMPGKAITQRERAVSLRPDLTGVRVEIARAYGQAGNTKKAVQTLLALATYYGQTGDRELALITVQEALRINPQHPKALEMIERLS